VTRLTRAESQARTRTQLLRTARELFLRDGYLATSLDKVADAAGFSKGAVYSNFRNKDELCLAVLDELRAERVAEVAGLLGAPTTEERLRRFEEWAERVIGDPQWTTLEFEFAVQARRDPGLRQEMADRLTAVSRVVEAAVADLTAGHAIEDSRDGADEGSGGHGTAGDSRRPGTDQDNHGLGTAEDDGRLGADQDNHGHRTGEDNRQPSTDDDTHGHDTGEDNHGLDTADGNRQPGADEDNHGYGDGDRRPGVGESGADGRGTGAGDGRVPVPMAGDEVAVALLCLGVGLGLFRSIDPSMPVGALVNTVRVLTGLPAAR
jgi:AcrR family transcriptional regulator